MAPVMVTGLVRGASFLFGKLTTDVSLGAVLAFEALPIVVFVSAVSEIAGRRTRLRFTMRSAKLYAFEFTTSR